VDNLGALSGEVVDNLWINPVDNPSEDIYQRACYAGNKHTHERESIAGVRARINRAYTRAIKIHTRGVSHAQNTLRSPLSLRSALSLGDIYYRVDVRAG
jgi:hypothetical protein